MLFKQSLKQVQTNPQKEKKNCLSKEVEMLLHSSSPTGHCACLCKHKRSLAILASLWRVPLGPFPSLQPALLG